MNRYDAFMTALFGAVQVFKSLYVGARHMQPNQLSLEVTHKVEFNA